MSAVRGGALTGTLTLAAVLLGCESTPSYGPQVSPYVGMTWAEDSVIATGTAQQLGLLSDYYGDGPSLVSVSLPAGAYPPGTRVTLRWVAGLGLASDESLEFGSFELFGPADAALQLLPPSPAPAVPLQANLIGSTEGAFDVLHANECDSAWQVVGSVRTVLVTTLSRSNVPSLSFQMSGPGLWTLGQPLMGQDGGTVGTGAPPTDAGCATSSNGGADSGQKG